MYWEGWNIGAVSIQRVRIHTGGNVETTVRRHAGNLQNCIAGIIAEDGKQSPAGIAITGPLAAAILDLPYVPESVAIERAMRALIQAPDLILSLGGEAMIVYCIHEQHVRSMVTSSRCAAGSGEFIVQQLGRMGLDLNEGLRLAVDGKHVGMASRCSVHIKSDATHKLNKGECTPADIAHTLVVDLAAKIILLIRSTSWNTKNILVSGGMSQNQLLMDELRRMLPESNLTLLPVSTCLEAYGAAISARSNPPSVQTVSGSIRQTRMHPFQTFAALGSFLSKVRRHTKEALIPACPKMQVLLGIDAGSTTTKAVLTEKGSGRLVAACYLRTHGNPVKAATQCLAEIQHQIAACPVEIIQTAVTGSGRELVSVAFGGTLSFNEILAHARAARAEYASVDTIFEIGGQDAKFISLHQGVPVDYAMNDGCSAGTGSFLEETAASDMRVPTEQIGACALQAAAPLAFNERCSAFINSEIRTALQGGANPNDILAGLVYSIVNNYLSRVVGTRSVGTTVLLQGGVALNEAVAAAVAAITGRNVIVPGNPELMGCIGAAYMAQDLLAEDKVPETCSRLDQLQQVDMQPERSFQCKSCTNSCEIQRIKLRETVYPFGGLCSRWEMQRRPKALRFKEGKDLTSLRSRLMFETFAAPAPLQRRGRVGLPLALSTFELFPFYSRLLTQLGYQVVLSRPGMGSRNTHAPFCYPAELLHAAVDDLLQQGVDWVFLPTVLEYAIPDTQVHGYGCAFSEDSASILREFFAGRGIPIHSPEIGFSKDSVDTSRKEICRLAEQLGMQAEAGARAFQAALDWQTAFEQRYHEEGRAALQELEGARVYLVGRPYITYNEKVNLSLPRKIASRGFHVVPGDLLPLDPPPTLRNVWHFTQSALSAIHQVKSQEDAYICYISCFSCSPDAIFYHRMRSEMEGKPFCFLEIDSHTADAGIDTRIGAFLDIIEKSRISGDSTTLIKAAWMPVGRIDYSGHRPRILLDSGEMIGFDHRRVLHVQLADTSALTARVFSSMYGRLGWRSIVTPFTNETILQAARRVCSGRECLPFLSMAGKMVLHLEKRPADEVTVFHMLEQEGPCQVGNWYDASALIFKKLGYKDAFCVWPRIENNYLCGGEGVALILSTGVVLGDLFEEMRSSLRCLVEDPQEALGMLDGMQDRLVAATARGLAATEIELRRIANELGTVRLKQPMHETPRVLLFSGINRLFVDKPVREFFERHGILSKTGDASEFLCLCETETVCRRGWRVGSTSPERQFALSTLVRGILNPGTGQKRFMAVRARLHVVIISLLDHRWRAILAKTGLIFSPDIHYMEMLKCGNQVLSYNGFTEAPFTAGRYLLSIQEDLFDGLVNVGAFNCVPANNATAAIHETAARSFIPYAVIESDGASITASQLRQLEAVAVNCQELRRQRVESGMK